MSILFFSALGAMETWRGALRAELPPHTIWIPGESFDPAAVEVVWRGAFRLAHWPAFPG